jgi:hypothetical protein
MTWEEPKIWSQELVTDAMMNSQVSGNMNHLGAMRFAGVALSALAAGTSAARIAVGYYMGNAAVSQAITGVGFKPVLILIYPRVAAVMAFHADGEVGTYFPAGTPVYAGDHIISCDVDGFTVGDGTGDANRLNVSSRIYTYIALG